MSTLSQQVASVFESLTEERDDARNKLAAVYSILARRETPYGDETEALVLTAASLAAQDGLELAKALEKIKELETANPSPDIPTSETNRNTGKRRQEE